MSDRSVLHSLAVTLADSDSVSDADLLRRYAESADAVAFELLVRRHAELVWAVCRSAHPGDHQTAEDAFQATFLALARKAGSVRGPSVAGWLFRVARNAAVRAKRRPDSPLSDEVAVVPTDRAESTEVVRIVSEEVDRLAAKFREPVLLCFYEGFSHAQAAERLGWAVGTVASRLARAKDRLRDRLTRRGVALPAAGIGALVGGSAPASAIKVAVRGNTTDAVRTLSTEVLRSMTIHKLTLAAYATAVLLLGGMGTVLAWPSYRDDKKAEVKGAKAKPEDDLKALQGKWKPVKIASKEGEAPADELKGMSWEIEGDKILTIDKPGEDRKEEMSFTLDATTSPKQIDLTALTGPAAVKGKVMPAIYELKGGKLTICLRPAEIADEGRPTEFKADKDIRTALIVLEKEKK
jgi:RNA polymerase sigma factor (sigma-70 family)